MRLPAAAPAKNSTSNWFISNNLFHSRRINPATLIYLRTLWFGRPDERLRVALTFGVSRENALTCNRSARLQSSADHLGDGARRKVGVARWTRRIGHQIGRRVQRPAALSICTSMWPDSKQKLLRRQLTHLCVCENPPRLTGVCVEKVINIHKIYLCSRRAFVHCDPRARKRFKCVIHMTRAIFAAGHTQRARFTAIMLREWELKWGWGALKPNLLKLIRCFSS